jgi:hypothetical protein
VPSEPEQAVSTKRSDAASSTVRPWKAFFLIKVISE